MISLPLFLRYAISPAAATIDADAAADIFFAMPRYAPYFIFDYD